MKPRLIYILAPSYSGSTLLTFLLAKHLEISTVGELKANNLGDHEEYFCSCGVVLGACPFWIDVTRIFSSKVGPFSLAEFGTAYQSSYWLYNKILGTAVRGGLAEALRKLAIRSLPGLKHRVDEVTRRNFALSQIVCEVQGGSFFLDGSKDAARLLYFVESNLWDIKVIYLKRDGRGLINSNMKHRGVDFRRASADWVRTITELENARAMVADDAVFDLMYERLCTDTTDTIARLWNWLGLTDIDVEHTDAQSDDQHILGNAMRLKRIEQVRLDESWRTSLQKADIRWFDEYLSQFNRRQGY